MAMTFIYTRIESETVDSGIFNSFDFKIAITTVLLIHSIPILLALYAGSNIMQEEKNIANLFWTFASDQQDVEILCKVRKTFIFTNI